jgi:hypothetical protein
MTPVDEKRRLLLQLMAYAPVGFLIGCGTERAKTTDEVPLLSPEESLRKLILVLGPWTAESTPEAERFAGRFLRARHITDAYLPRSNKVVQSLASRFPRDVMAVREVSLNDLLAKERDLLFALSEQIYSLTEVRFLVAGEPPIGECQNDATFHTRAPM